MDLIQAANGINAHNPVTTQSQTPPATPRAPTPATSTAPPQPPKPADHLRDPEVFRNYAANGVIQRLAGAEDPWALVKLSNRERRELNNLSSLIKEFSDEADLDELTQWVYREVSGKLASQKSFEKMSDNYSKPVEEKGWMDKMMNRKPGGQ